MSLTNFQGSARARRIPPGLPKGFYKGLSIVAAWTVVGFVVLTIFGVWRPM